MPPDKVAKTKESSKLLYQDKIKNLKLRIDKLEIELNRLKDEIKKFS